MAGGKVFAEGEGEGDEDCDGEEEGEDAGEGAEAADAGFEELGGGVSMKGIGRMRGTERTVSFSWAFRSSSKSTRLWCL